MQPPAETRLIERDTELEALRAALASARAERGGLVLVEGEGGIGKTRLLAATAADAAAADVQVLRATGRILEQDMPFGVVRQLIDPILRRAGAREREELLQGAAALVRPLIEDAQAGSATSVQHGLLWLLVGLSERAPLALLIDDAHLADEPSLRALAYLAARIEDLPVALVVAHRPAHGAAADVLQHLRALPAASRLQPEPLTRAGVGLLIADAGLAGAAPGFVEACTQAAGGNPLFVRELLMVAAERDIPATDEGGDRLRGVGPAAVAEAVLLALGRHGPEATRVVRALAILGDAARLADVAALARVDPGTTVDLAVALTQDGVLRSTGDDVSFAHPIVGQAVRDHLEPLERARGHGEAARVLHAAGAPDEQVAAHLVASAPAGEAWAGDVLRGAAARASDLGQHDTAARLLSRALEEPGAHDDTIVRLARAEAAAGTPAAAARFDLAISRTPDPVARADLRLGLGRALMHQGRFAEAAAAFAHGAAEATDADPGLAAELRASWAGAALWNADEGAEAMQAIVSTILDMTDPAGAGERMALAHLAGGMMLQGGDHATARELAERAWGDGALLETVGPEDPTIYSCTAVFMEADARPRADEVYTRVRETARERGLALAAATATYGVSAHRQRIGALAEAVAEATLALDAEAQGWGLYAAATRCILVRSLIDLGRLDAAQAALQVSPERAAELRQGSDGGALDLAHAELALARGQAGAALEHLRAVEAAMAPVGVLLGQYDWRPPLVRALVLAGDREAAAEVAQACVAASRAWGAPTALGVALRHEAMVRDGNERLAALHEAVALLEDTDASLERAFALTDLGIALREAGDAVAARDPLRRALDLADERGAVPLAARAREELVRAGARPRRARLRGVDALTPGELQVVRLAIEGRTNREIAEALFVTPKAVRWHLGNAYRKLGVVTREELPGALGPQPAPPAEG